jgi:hypothetical protein
MQASISAKAGLGHQTICKNIQDEKQAKQRTENYSISHKEALFLAFLCFSIS